MDGVLLIGSFSSFIILGIGGLISYGRLSTRVDVNEERLKDADDKLVTKDSFEAFRDESFRRLERIEGKLDRINGRS